MKRWDWTMLVWSIVLVSAALTAIYPGWGVIAKALSSDAAPAWVQAITSSLALIVAVAVVAYQHRLARLHDEENERKRLLRQFGVTHWTALQVIGVCRGLQGSTSKFEWSDRYLLQIDELLSQVRDLQYTDQPALELVIRIGWLRQLLVDLRGAAGAYVGDKTPVDEPRHRAKLVADEASRLSALAKALFTATATPAEERMYFSKFKVTEDLQAQPSASPTRSRAPS